jgi:hypothetical protein
LRLRAVTANITRALGFLTLSLFAAVLLGRFVQDLPAKEFWIVIALTFVLSLRPVHISRFSIAV